MLFGEGVLMPDLKFACPNCRNHLVADTCQAAQLFPCPHCGYESRVPSMLVTTPHSKHKSLVRWSIVALSVILTMGICIGTYQHYSSRYLRAAYAYWNIEQLDNAVSAFEQHLVLHPGDLIGRRALAKLLSSKGDNDRACKLYYSIVSSRPKWDTSTRLSLMMAWQDAIRSKLIATNTSAEDFLERKEYTSSAASFHAVQDIYYRDVQSWLFELMRWVEDDLRSLPEGHAAQMKEEKASFVLNYYHSYNVDFANAVAKSLFADWLANPPSISRVLDSSHLCGWSGISCKVDNGSFIATTGQWSDYTNSIQSIRGAPIRELAHRMRFFAQKLEREGDFLQASDVFQLSASLFDDLSCSIRHSDTNASAIAVHCSCASSIDSVRCLCKGPNSPDAGNALSELTRKIKEQGVILFDSEKRQLIDLCILLADRASAAGQTNLARIRRQYADEMAGTLR